MVGFDGRIDTWEFDLLFKKHQKHFDIHFNVFVFFSEIGVCTSTMAGVKVKVFSMFDFKLTISY